MCKCLTDFRYLSDQQTIILSLEVRTPEIRRKLTENQISDTYFETYIFSQPYCICFNSTQLYDLTLPTETFLQNIIHAKNRTSQEELRNQKVKHISIFIMQLHFYQVTQEKNKSKPESIYTSKCTKPSFLRKNKFRKSSLDVKSLWRRSAPGMTLTKKDEYMFMDFTNKAKPQSCSTRKRWNRLTL